MIDRRHSCVLLTALLVACGEAAPAGPEPVPTPVPPSILRLQPDAGLLAAGETLRLEAMLYDEAGQPASSPSVAWSSSDPAVATVDEIGRVTAHAPGSVEIVARGERVEARASVGVLDASDESEVCDAGGPTVALIIEADLAEHIRPRLSRFAADLCTDGYRVSELRSRLVRAGEIRGWLMREHARTGGSLEGAILVGDIPHAYQWVIHEPANPALPTIRQEVISFQYYADLDGRFDASPAYLSRAGRVHSYDRHTGAVDWELWVGALPPHPDGPAANAAAIDTYLDRNHAWRNGGSKPPRAFLQVNEHLVPANADEHASTYDWLRRGPYAWLPFSAEPGTQIYFDSHTAGRTVQQGYAALEQGVADFTVLEAHGSPRRSGELTVDWARSAPIATNFLWSDGCAVGDLDYADNFLTAVLYGPNSQVLVAKGSTHESGGMGMNEDGWVGRNVASAMVAGESLGRAIVQHVDVPLIEPWAASREFYYASFVLVGDPTLRLRD